jgi:quercetin dioxygenase-like cupin family protein
MENAMRNHKYTQYWNRLKMGSMLFAFAAAIGGATLPPTASAQDKKDEISFDLVANPGAASGGYTVRVKMPDGYRIAPHWHPLRENVTVISGTFKVGMGHVFETNKMTTLPAGSFAFLDPDMHHYAMASGQVVVQIHGMAPLQFNYVNPGDDPSRNK